MDKNIFPKIVTAVFPDRCLFCRKVAKPRQICCDDFFSTLPWLEGKRLTPNPNDPFVFVASPFVYRAGVRQSIGQLKFHGQTKSADFFAEYMLEAVEPCFVPDWVVSVPMNPGRLSERGYNQDELLGAPIAQKLSLVDDIFNTGSTLRRCAWLLKDAGAKEVGCVVAAATPNKR